jgi:response regulator RpfG family c-di-GMP phosphodiesterase
MIRDASGSQFDPEVVAAFLEIPVDTLDRIRLEIN